MRLRLLEVADVDDDEGAETVDDARCWKNDVIILEVSRSSTIADVRTALRDSLQLSSPHCPPVIRIFYRGRELHSDWHVCASRLSAHECLVFTCSDSPQSSHPSLSPSTSPSSASDDLHDPSSFNAPVLRLCGLESMAQLSPRAQRAVQRTVAEARRGLLAGQTPTLAADGSGGTYMLRNAAGRCVACFKPRDEEPAARNNPRAAAADPLRAGVLVGEAVQRELAAFLTDDGGFSGVPATALVEAAHPAFHYCDGAVRPKTGSLQSFVNGDGPVSDFSAALFPVEEVQKIAVLDIRLLNTDRNDGNLMVSRRPLDAHTRLGDADAMLLRSAAGSLSDADDDDDKQDADGAASAGALARPPPLLWPALDGGRAGLRKPRALSCSPPAAAFAYSLTPIDHGYCLPDRAEVRWSDWCWIDWPQTRGPVCAAVRRFVERYDPDAAAAKLRRELNVREACLRVMRASGRLLKRGVAAGLTLHEVASIAARQDDDAPSLLETQMSRAEELARAMLGNARIRQDEAVAQERQQEEEQQPCGHRRQRSSIAGRHTLPKFSGLRRATLSSVELSSLGHGNLSSDRGRDQALRPAPLHLSNNGDDEPWAGEKRSDTQFRRQRLQTVSALVLPYRATSAGLDACPHRHRSANAVQLAAAAAAARRARELQQEQQQQQQQGEDDVGDDDNGDNENEEMDKLFFAYLERLLEDVIACVLRRRHVDSMLFRRRGSVQQLTSPHRRQSRSLSDDDEDGADGGAAMVTNPMLRRADSCGGAMEGGKGSMTPVMTVVNEASSTLLPRSM